MSSASAALGAGATGSDTWGRVSSKVQAIQQTFSYNEYVERGYSQIIQVMDDHFSIETDDGYGDLGLPAF